MQLVHAVHMQLVHAVHMQHLAPLGSGLVEGDYHRVGHLGALLDAVDVELQHVEDVLVGDGREHLGRYAYSHSRARARGHSTA